MEIKAEFLEPSSVTGKIFFPVFSEIEQIAEFTL